MPRKKKIKIVAVGDTHRQHWELKIPKCDIFIFAGDGEINSLLALHDFNDWLGTIDASIAKIIIMGNHDGYAEEIGKDWCKKLFTNAIYLEDEEITIAGLKFYGFINYLRRKRAGDEKDGIFFNKARQESKRILV